MVLDSVVEMRCGRCQMNHVMLRFDHLVQTVGEFGSEMVVEEKLHAASVRSNRTASRTEAG